MKKLVLVFLLFCSFVNAQSLVELRGYLQKVENSEEVSKTLISKSIINCLKYNEKIKKPLIHKGSALLVVATTFSDTSSLTSTFTDLLSCFICYS